MPPFLFWMMGTLGGALLAKVAAREFARINEELDKAQLRTGMDQSQPRPMGKLERDPQTGVYRPR